MHIKCAQNNKGLPGKTEISKYIRNDEFVTYCKPHKEIVDREYEELDKRKKLDVTVKSDILARQENKLNEKNQNLSREVNKEQILTNNKGPFQIIKEKETPFARKEKFENDVNSDRDEFKFSSSDFEKRQIGRRELDSKGYFGSLEETRKENVNGNEDNERFDLMFNLDFCVLRSKDERQLWRDSIFNKVMLGENKVKKRHVMERARMRNFFKLNELINDSFLN